MGIGIILVKPIKAIRIYRSLSNFSISARTKIDIVDKTLSGEYARKEGWVLAYWLPISVR